MSENKWDIGLGLYLKNDEIEKIQKQIDGIGQAKPIALKINSSEITKQIDDIKKQIQSLGNIKINLTNSTNNSSKYTPSISHQSTNNATNNTAKQQLSEILSLQSRIGNLKIKIQGLENAGKDVSNLTSLLQGLETTYNGLVSKFQQSSTTTADFEKINRAVENTKYKLDLLQSSYEDARRTFANKIQTDFIGSNKLTTDISKLNTDFQQLGIESNEITGNIHTLRTLLSQMDGNDDIESVIADYEKFQQILISTINKVKEQQIQLKQSSDTAKLVADRNKLNRDIELWFKRNTEAAKQFGNKMREIQAQVQTADGTKLNALKSQFQAVATEAKIAGDNALTFGDRLKAQVSKLSVYFSGIMLITKSAQVLKNMINQVVSLDTALIDLKKTTTATDEELRKFYFDANETGKKLGTTTQGVIQAAADWSRLGYSLKDAQEMAKTSSIFASISPGVDIEKATDGLVSAMKAYKIEASDALDEVASKINAVGNSQALNNSDIVEFLTRSSSAMASANNTLDETIALGTAITEITRDAANAGQVMKTASMRLRGYDEDTEELSNDVQALVGDIADLTKTVQHPMGISIFSDEAKTEYKSTVQVLREISGIWNELTDKQQARVLEALGGKRGGQALAAALNNFEAVEKSLNTMQHSAGNAMQEMSIIEESLDYKLNKLKETGVGVAQNVFSQESISGWIKLATKVLEIIDSLTKSVGGLGTAFTAFMAYKGFKNVGRTKMFVLHNRICRQQ